MSSDKVVAAREWGDAIHVVRVEWLLACVREWRRVSEQEFEVKDVNEDDVETGDDELEGNVEKKDMNEDDVETGDDELEGNVELKNDKMEEEKKKDVNEDDVETGDDELEGNVEKEKEEEVETEDDKKKEEITGTQANTKLSQKRILSLPPNTKKANTTAIP